MGSLKTEIRLIKEVMPSSSPLMSRSVPDQPSSSSQSGAISISNQPGSSADVQVNGDKNFVLHGASTDEVFMSFLTGTPATRYRINCSLQAGYPAMPPIWFCDSSDADIERILDNVNAMNSHSYLLLEMVKRLVMDLVSNYSLPSPQFLSNLLIDDAFDESDEEENNEGSEEGSSENDDFFDDADFHMDLSDDEAAAAAAAGEQEEGGSSRKRQSVDAAGEELEPDKQLILDRLVALQTQKNVTAASEAATIASTLARSASQPGVAQAAVSPASSSLPQQHQTPGSGSGGKSKLKATWSSIQATDRLMKELRDTFKSDNHKQGVFSVELVDDNLYEWNVKLNQVDPESSLAKDMKKYERKFGVHFIHLNITYKPTFPYSPPFIRVVRPPIAGGFVLSGGAICMELLTTQGWSSAYSIEHVIVQIQATIVKGRARINFSETKGVYTLTKAQQSFKTLEAMHLKNGWNTPPKWEG
jgi:ubiquitin-conjugating enzyme E2 Q